ncbi:MAG: CBS domain-containing protein [Burkholderiaceae bacterium]
MHTDVAGIPADMPANEVAQLFEEQDLLSAPVVDADQRLLGRITVDDVVDQIREDADRSVMQMAGLNQEADTFAPSGLDLATALCGWASIW